MPIDQMQGVFQMFLGIALVLLIGPTALTIHRMMNKPKGTYGNGLPERRKRPRLTLPDPATLQPRMVPPGSTI
jgi:hypothetical protein